MRGPAGPKAVRSYVDVDVEVVIEFINNFVNFLVIFETEEFFPDDMTVQLNCEN